MRQRTLVRQVLKSEELTAIGAAILWQAEAPTGLDAFFGVWLAQSGLGWTVGERDGYLLVGHPVGGAGQNIGSQLALADNVGVTVLANWGTELDAYPAWTAAADVLYHLLGLASQGAD